MIEKPAGTVGERLGEQLADTGPDASGGEPKRRPGRFLFPSGSTPLAGYTIKRGIGAGGFGEVYYATSDGGKEVALKYIQRHLDIELRGVRQCLNLKHPNLLALYDIREDEGGLAWVVMEFVAGESLKEVIERHPNGVPVDQVREWFRAIGQAVIYLHDHGIVHRDLKPSNLFLDQGTVKIGDYGLSKFISCSRRSGHTESVGTFHYMAPEIGQGRYGKEIDIYALGVVLHELLTGRVPFDGESSQEIIMKHLTAQPDLRALASPYREVLVKALAKRPEDRYRSMQEMLVDLGLAPRGSARDEPSRIDADRAGAQSQPTAERDAPENTHTAGDVISPGEAANEGRPIPIEIVGQQVFSGDRVWPPVVVPSMARSPMSAGSPATGRPIRESKAPGSVFPEPVRWVLLVATVLLIITRARWLLPIALTVGTIYGFYLLFSVLVDLTFGDPDTDNLADDVRSGVAAAIPSAWRPEVEQHRMLDPLRAELAAKSWLDRLAELHGSMLISAIVAAVVCFGMTAFTTQGFAGAQWTAWAPHFAWLTIPSILGSWSLLAIGKFWESRDADPSMRRFFQTLVGLAVGGFTGWLSGYLQVEPRQLINVESLLNGRLPELMFTAPGAPSPYAYALYFGALFMIVRWWRRTDPLRPSRLGFWSTLSPPLAAVLLCLLLPIPQGFLIATAVTLALQISATWIGDERRRPYLPASWNRAAGMALVAIALTANSHGTATAAESVEPAAATSESASSGDGASQPAVAEVTQLAIEAPRPAWVDAPDEQLRRSNIERVTARGATPRECQDRLEQEINLKIYKQLELLAQRDGLDADLVSRLRAEDVDRSLLTVQRYIERVSAGDEGASLDGYQGWAALRFPAEFTAAIESQITGLAQRDAVTRIGWVAMGVLVAVTFNFGYLQGLRRLSAPWSARGMVMLGVVWCLAVGAAAVLVRTG